MNTKQAQRLEKVWALAVDKANEGNGEAANAMEKLRELCGKYKVNFDEFIKSKQPSAAQATEQQTVGLRNFPSRRGFIIHCLYEGIWDRKSIAEAVVLHFPHRYTDLKQNATAVTGTIGDLRTNKKLDIRVCEVDGRIWVKPAKSNQ